MRLKKPRFVHRDHLYKQRKVKRRSIDLRRGGAPGPGAVGGAEREGWSRADIHPELTMDKIQNHQDGRRANLASFGSR